MELQEYIYGVSATYPENNEESVILIHPESISILPASYQELSWDDGSFESSFELEQNDSLASKFRASNLGQQIVRFKWYQIDDGGIIRIIIWDNSFLIYHFGGVIPLTNISLASVPLILLE